LRLKTRFKKETRGIRCCITIVMPSGALPVLNFMPARISRNSDNLNSYHNSHRNNSAPTDALPNEVMEMLNQRLDDDVAELIKCKHKDLVEFPTDLEAEVVEIAPDENSNSAGVAFNVQFQAPRIATPETDGSMTLVIVLNLNRRIGQLTDEGTPISGRFPKESLEILINLRSSTVGEKIQQDINNNNEAQRILSVINNQSEAISTNWMWFSYKFDDAGPTEDQAWFVAKYLYAHFMIAFVKIKEKLQEALRAQDPDVYDQPNVYNLDENGDRYRMNNSYRLFLDFATAVQDEKRKQLQEQFPDKDNLEIEQMMPRFGVV
jgi:hypothetical protein